MTLPALLLMSALGNPGETVLLEFTMPGCVPCRTMQPVVQRLKREGVPVRQVDITRDRTSAARFRVHQVPCFVMMVRGREVDRVVGSTTYHRLVSMTRRGASQRGLAGNVAAAVPSKTVPAVVQPLARPRPAGVAKAPAGVDVRQRALAATVRLRVEDDRGTSYGTGTVIDRHGAEALVLTCGHVFRDSAGKGTIHVDLFVQGSVRTVRGELIAYDAQRDDVGLVSIRPGVRIEPVSVAAATVAPALGQQVFAVGCNRGAGPTVLSGDITGVNRFVGSPNFTVRGRPTDGRSGGGLFTARGELIGLCKWAVSDADEGVYAGLVAVRQQLSKVGLRSLLEPAALVDGGESVESLVPAEPASPLTQVAAPRPSSPVNSLVPVGMKDPRQAEYEAKLQAIEKAYQIAREALEREYHQSADRVAPVEMAITVPGSSSISPTRLAQPGTTIIRGQSSPRR